MNEVESIIELAKKATLDNNTKNVLSQIGEFERYLAEMSITVDKKQILLHREDITPQSIFFNFE